MSDGTTTIGLKAARQASYCRRQAKAVRRLAEAKQHLRATLLGVASEYDQLAEDLELGAAVIRHAVLLPLD